MGVFQLLISDLVSNNDRGTKLSRVLMSISTSNKSSRVGVYWYRILTLVVGNIRVSKSGRFCNGFVVVPASVS